jgi:drug/metabolite transporter (DMT)-like permease
VLLFLGCHGLLAWAEQRVSSGRAALFMAAIPLWLVLLDALRLRRRPTGHVLAGLAVGTLGVAVLSGGAGGLVGSAADGAALILGALCWAAGSLVARHGARSVSAAQATSMQLATGAVAVLGASAAGGELAVWSPEQVTARAAAALAFLIVCGTVLGFGAYTWLLRMTTPAAVSTYAFVNPVVALALAWMVGDELLTPRTLLAALLVLAAVFLIRERPRASAEARPG